LKYGGGCSLWAIQVLLILKTSTFLYTKHLVVAPILGFKESSAKVAVKERTIELNTRTEKGTTCRSTGAQSIFPKQLRYDPIVWKTSVTYAASIKKYAHTTSPSVDMEFSHYFSVFKKLSDNIFVIHIEKKACYSNNNHYNNYIHKEHI
jgi:hypothetical protein